MPKQIRDCVVFAGQSNGITFNNSAAFPGGWPADPNTLIWTGSPPAWAQYDPATNADPRGTTCWGPEAEFARRWRIDSPQPLFIIKRCIGNEGMVFATPPGVNIWSPYVDGQNFSNLYDDVVAATSATSLTSTDVSLDIRAFVYIGCESDTSNLNTQANADKLQRELEAWFRAMRTVLLRPDALGIVVVLKDSAPNGPFRGTIRRAQRYVGLLPGNTYVDENPLDFQGTNPGDHLTTTSVVSLGGLLYDAYKAATTRVIP